MKKYFLPLIAVLILAGGGTAYYLYNKKPPSINDLKTDIQIGADELITQYEEYEDKANESYLEKVIEVVGEVEKAEMKDGVATIYLKTNGSMGSVLCQLEDAGQLPEPGQTVKIKGVCTGYLMDVVLIKCKLL